MAAALVGVVAQRLVRNVCPSCRTTYYPSREYLEALHYRGDMHRAFVRGEGCRECYDTGYQGRSGVYEVLPVDSQLRSMIGSGISQEAIRAHLTQEGQRTLLDSGLELAEQQMTSLEEVSRVAFFE